MPPAKKRVRIAPSVVAESAPVDEDMEDIDVLAASVAPVEEDPDNQPDEGKFPAEGELDERDLDDIIEEDGFAYNIDDWMIAYEEGKGAELARAGDILKATWKSNIKPGRNGFEGEILLQLVKILLRGKKDPVATTHRAFKLMLRRLYLLHTFGEDPRKAGAMVNLLKEEHLPKDLRDLSTRAALRLSRPVGTGGVHPTGSHQGGGGGGGGAAAPAPLPPRPRGPGRPRGRGRGGK